LIRSPATTAERRSTTPSTGQLGEPAVLPLLAAAHEDETLWVHVACLPEAAVARKVLSGYA
jgi:hypothetical protein